MVHHSPLRSHLAGQRADELIKIAATRGVDANALAHALGRPSGLLPRRRRGRRAVAALYAGARGIWSSGKEEVRGTPITLGRCVAGGSGSLSSPFGATPTPAGRGSTPGI